jgi:energy-coupling factor transporter ATP-binding protein EcfA2
MKPPHDFNFNGAKNILIIGKENSGKTELIKHIISLQEPNTIFYLLTQQHFSYNCKGSNEIETLKKSYLDIIIQNSGTNKKTCVIFDELLHYDYDKNIFNKYLQNSRHYNITNIISLQFDCLTPNIRSNIDVKMLFEHKNREDISRYHHLYFDTLQFDLYKKLLETNAKDYNLLCIYNKAVFAYSFEKVSSDKFFISEYLDPHPYEQSTGTELEYIDNKLSIEDKKDIIKIINKILEQNDRLVKILENLQ